MTLLFTAYLKKNHIQAQQLCDPQTRNHHINIWLKQLRDAVEQGSTYYPTPYANLGRSFLEFINKHHLQQPWNEENVQRKLFDIDQKTHFFYKKLINYAIELSKKSPINSVLHPYPYPSRYSGVSMSAYVVQETNHHGPEIHGNKYWDADDFLQHKAMGSDIPEIKEKIRTNVNGAGVSRPLSARIVQNLSHFHAEEHWFATELTNLIEYLKTHRASWVMSKPEDDEIWIQQLKALTRIEFVISSSPCEHCQLLFKDLRRVLNELNLMIPIIIFSNSPTNTAEEDSQIALVKFNGEYFNTGLIPNTPHAKAKRERNKTFNLINTFRLFNQETQIFYRFEPLVGQVMPQMMSSSTTPKVRNEFIDDMFNFFGHCLVVNKNALPWFICFLKNLPEVPGGFYTSNRMQECFPIDDHPNAYEMGIRILRETRVKSFLDTLQGNNLKKIDYLNPTLKGSHINTEPQSFTYIADKFQLLMRPYAEHHEKTTLLDYLEVKGRLESFYIKDKTERAEASENQAEYAHKHN